MSAPCPVFGFLVRLRLAAGSPDTASDQLRDDFIDMLEGHGLVCGGGGHAAEWEYTVWRDGSQAIDADRQVLRSWAASRPEIASVDVGPLLDLTGAP